MWMPLTRGWNKLVIGPLRWLARLTTAERVSLGCVLAAAYLLGKVHDRLPELLTALSVMVLIVVLAAIFRRAWQPLFGPVFFFDLVRSTRRSNFALLRGVYLLAILVLLFLIYANTVDTGSTSIWQILWKPVKVPLAEVARFGQSFFYVLVSGQFIAVVLLTPICAASAITEEKERRTLEYMLATELYDREIIFGKLASRLAYLILFVLTGLPVLSFLQFFGGVDPNLVVSAFIMTLMTMLSLTGISIVISVVSRRSRTAVFLTYVVVAGYFLLSSCCCAVPVPWLTLGNAFVAVSKLFVSSRSDDILDGLPLMVFEYSFCHLFMAGICFQIATSRLRSRATPPLGRSLVEYDSAWVRSAPDGNDAGTIRSASLAEVGMAETDSATEYIKRKRSARATDPSLWRVWNWPILWKELYAEPMFPPGSAGKALLWAFWFLVALQGAYLLLLSFTVAAATGDLGTFTNGLARYAGAALSSAMFIGIVIRAASTLTSERDRQTLDSLLTTPLDTKRILFEKWLGSVLCIRKLWFALLPIWGLGLFLNGVHPLAFAMLLVAWCAYAGVAAGIGMLFSLTSRNSLRAVIGGLLTFVVICSAHRGLVLGWLLSYEYRAVPPPYAWIADFDLYGLLPPVTLSSLAFRASDLTASTSIPKYPQILLYCSTGVLLYGLLALLLWWLLCKRFGPVTGRMPLPRSRV